MQSQILPSRAALVDRIAMQFEYGQSLICLVGNSGLGKSYLAESFITDKYSDFSKAFIQLSAHSKDVDVVRQLMEHTFRAPLVDQKLSLTENFFVLNSEQPAGPCLWVLDGARHLSDELITELQNLVVRAPNTLYVLVTAQAPNMLPNALDIHLEPLSLFESKQLMRMFFPELPSDDDPIFSTFVSEAHGNPSVLLDWQQDDQQLDLRANMPSKGKQKHFFIVAFSLILSLCLIAALYNKQLLDLLQTKRAVSEQTAVVVTEPTVFEAQQVLEAQSTQVESTPSFTSSHLSEDDTEEKNTEEVSAILGALLSEPLVTETEKSHNVETAKPTAPNGITSPQVISKPELSDMPIVETVSNESNALQEGLQLDQRPDSEPDREKLTREAAALSVNDNSWFLLRADTEWSIQLLAVTDQKVAVDFIQQHALDNVKVAQVIRSGRTWWFVTLAPFAQLDDAKAARSKLSRDLLAAKPFFKRISQIKQQIQQSQ
ncbi:SPOR domain-containing protein [Pseudoalteromonas luteoviolacea]|uniref:SPOR domain-containing protein n=1 Tax=Pseudoalteromonas luteoviolacea S4054 TaxID=1129367 RepID=A0A0F6A5D7_9GAMM|nr:AAA family ATPase [Pseudoalteromonas luteoviolacea]AOT06620.1 hypothetical protein S4054249_01385 [Pseudoalteromonas luteoviolacea]AOT11537.1 hypothetical protein S40542_01385 [Pseudoalteromonas luteoviolacea]AOT16450.1 hypothetical protein S4054_01385 [Pseudoalteromonas luteoviolacea]KKE81061.1 hypothetical protein N479_03380 [Pseudoalteromonas luteoviolacea S4054]KZN62531.1 hypothetical protein N481_03555 [Pseudoalteromonas luteoviolacea S4047-1]